MHSFDNKLNALAKSIEVLEKEDHIMQENAGVEEKLNLL